MKYRQATISDLNSFFEFFKGRLKKYFLREKNSFDDYTPLALDYMLTKDYNRNKFKKWLENKKRIIYLSLDKNRIKGCLMVEKPDGGVSFGHWLMVDKNYRDKGIATNLLSNWEKDVLNWGGHMVYLSTEQRNLEFYKKRGFIHAGLMPKSWFGADHHRFYKMLQEPMEENYLRDYLKKKKRKGKSSSL